MKRAQKQAIINDLKKNLTVEEINNIKHKFNIIKETLIVVKNERISNVKKKEFDDIKKNLTDKEKEIGDQLQKMCFQDPELKYLGKKAFESYVKSLWLQKDKEIFNIDKYDLEGFHASMGLPGAPKIKFRKGDDTKKLKNAPRAFDDDSDEPKKPEVRTK